MPLAIPSLCRHSRTEDEPNGYTICLDCEKRLERWASQSADGYDIITIMGDSNYRYIPPFKSLFVRSLRMKHDTNRRHRH